MTPIIRDLAILLAQSIREHQGRFTQFNRKEALVLIEDQLTAQHATDEDLVNAIMSARAHILSNRSFFNFGIWGRSNSYFLRATEDFIEQATHLICNLPTASHPHPQVSLLKRHAQQIVAHIDALPSHITGDPNLQRLLEFVWEAKNPQSSDTELLTAAIKYRNNVHQHRFAFWRYDWRIFTEINHLISQAKSLMKLSESNNTAATIPRQNQSPTRILADWVLTNIGEQSLANSPSLLDFETKVKDSQSSDTNILNAALHYHNNVQQHRFAFWRHDWSIFAKIKTFIAQAKLLLKLNPPKEPEEKPKVEPVIVKKKPQLTRRQVEVKLFEAKNKKYILMDIIRDTIEDVIYERLKAIHPNTSVTSGWHLRMQKVKQNEMDVDDALILEKGEFKNDEKLSEYATLYKALITDIAYKNFLRERSFKSENSPRVPRRNATPEKETEIQTKASVKTVKPEKPKRPLFESEELPKELQSELEQFDSQPRFKRLERIRANLENQIAKYISEIFADTGVKFAWDHYRKNGTSDDDIKFLNNYQKNLEDHPRLKRLMQDYREIFMSPEYVAYLNQRAEIIKKSAIQEEAKRSSINEDLKKFASEHPVSHPLDHSILRAEREAKLRRSTLLNFDREHKKQVNQKKKLTGSENEIGLEKEISNELDQKPYSLTRAPITWRMLTQKLNSNELDFNELIFFNTLRKDFDISPNSILSQKIAEYETIIRDRDYLDYVRRRAKLENASEQEIRNEFTKFIEKDLIKEVKEEYLRLGLFIRKGTEEAAADTKNKCTGSTEEVKEKTNNLFYRSHV